MSAPVITTRGDWVVIDAVNRSMLCLRCGLNRPLELPVSINTFVKRSEEFTRHHSKCLPKKPAKMVPVNWYAPFKSREEREASRAMENK